MHATPLSVSVHQSQREGGRRGVESGREFLVIAGGYSRWAHSRVLRSSRKPKIRDWERLKGRVKRFTPMNFEASFMGPKFIHLRYSIMNWVVWLESNNPRKQIISGVQV